MQKWNKQKSGKRISFHILHNPDLIGAVSAL